MKFFIPYKILLISTFLAGSIISNANSQNTESVTNNDNENVEINVQEAGSQQQGQSANGNTSDVTVRDEDSSDNFWSSGYRGQLIVPPGGASLSCGEQIISFSRSGGFGFGVGATGINLSDNQGNLPEEFKLSLAAIQQCAREKNIAEIIEQYVKLVEIDKAIAQTYLRTVSPEVYATLFVESSRADGEILTEQSFKSLTTNLRNAEFDRIVEWQDNFNGAAIDSKRVELRENRELRRIERQKRLAELEVLELERKTREAEAILKFQQSELERSLQNYQQN